MKRFVLGLICGLLLAVSTVTYASDTLQVYLFPAKFSFNGKVTEIRSDEYVILCHNGHAYVPIRFVAENVGSAVSYNESTQATF